jgi:hypothetical protein
VTLADLLVSTAVVGLVVGATLVTLEQGLQAFTVGAARVDAQQSARHALTWLTAELRQAGQGITAPDLPAISVAEPARVVLHVDRNHDRHIAGAGETIVWRLDRDILRRDAGGGAQPVINGVRALTFVYFDAAGARTTIPSAVRRIHITLTTGPSHTPSIFTTNLITTMTTEAHLRNR